MSIAEPIREKGRLLSQLARRLAEHLGGRSEEEWSESDVMDLFSELHQTMASLQSDLNLPTAIVPPEAPRDPPSAAAKQAIATRSLDPTMFAPKEADAPSEEATPEPMKPLDFSVLDEIDTPDLKKFDVTALQHKMAADADFVRGMLGDIKKMRSPASAEGTRWRLPEVEFNPPGGWTRDIALDPPASLGAGSLQTAPQGFDIGGGGGYYADEYGTLSAGESEVEGSGEDAEKAELEEFFVQVGRSLVSAQQQLDQRSQEYMAQLTQGGADPSMATLYRIPKVSAELKFGLEKVSKKGINLLIHRQGTQSSILNQQSVSFEIAAIPAPPGALAAVRQRAPQMQLLLDPEARRQILEALAAATAPSQAEEEDLAALHQAQERLAAHWEEVLLVEAGPGSGRHLVALVDDGDDRRLGLWLFEQGGDTSVDRPSRLTALVDVGEASAMVPEPLREWLRTLAERQAAFLGSL